MRAIVLILALVPATLSADWRDEVVRLAERGDAAAVVALAEAERTPWFAPHVASTLPAPRAYIGWVVTDTRIVAYRIGAEPAVRSWRRAASLAADLAALERALVRRKSLPRPRLARVRAAFVAPIADWLEDADAWVFATDGMAARVPWPLFVERPVVSALSARTAALSAWRVARARERPATLVAYARDGRDDPRALRSAGAEVALAATLLGGDATLIHGDGALARLRRAAYDGTLASARFVVIAAHASFTDDGISLELAPGDAGRYRPSDTLHLEFGAELVILSACETASGARFAEAATLAGVGQTLLTRWPVEDAAAAQFVGLVFDALAGGATVERAVLSARRAFSRGDYGPEYRHPFYWAGWVVWGGL